MRAAPLALAALCTGCGYQPSSFDHYMHRFAGRRATVGCLDLSVERRPSAPLVLAYDFGNRCDHPAMVDLAAVNVVATTTDGDPRELVAYDPRHEIEPLLLDGRSVGAEAIEYASDSELSSVCVDGGSIAHMAPLWLCMEAQ